MWVGVLCLCVYTHNGVDRWPPARPSFFRTQTIHTYKPARTSLLARGDLAMKSGGPMGGTTWRRSNFMQNCEPSATFCCGWEWVGVGVSGWVGGAFF